jgi:hypothetical protein
MTGRSRFHTAVLAVLILILMASAAGCAVSSAFRRTGDGRIEYTVGEGDSKEIWTWERTGSTAQITYNSKLFASVQSGLARITLPDGLRSAEVTLDGKGTPVSVKTAWGVALTQADYTLMNTAFYVNNEAGGLGSSSPLGWVIFLIIVIIAGVLLFVYAGSLVNSWKLGGIFGGTDTAKSLLIVKAAGIFVVIVGVLILLVVIF